MPLVPLGFGPFVLDPVARTLCRDGVFVGVGQKGLDLLGALIAAGGAVLSKHQLMERVWPDTFVEEGNLAVQISQLRRLIGRREDGTDWIKTVPRLGYCLPIDQRQGTSREDRQRPRLAVLPFRASAGDTAADYFVDGVVSDITTALTRFHVLSVVSPSAAFVYRGTQTPPQTVGSELGAQYVVEGSLRRDGDRLRITAQLIETTTGTQLLAQTFDGRMDEVFELQDRVAEGVAVRVAPTLLRSELARSRRERPGSAATYDIYLRALADLGEESEPANRRAFGLLERALESEPDNAAILSQAAWALEHRNTMGWPPLTSDDVTLCLKLARRGLQEAGGDANVMAQCGMALLQAGREYDTGFSVIRSALEANPHSTFVNAAAGVATMHCGDLAEAETILGRVLQIDPLAPETRFALTGLAMIRVIRGDYEGALPFAGRSLAVNAQFDATYWMLVAANALLGRVEEAQRHLNALVELAPGVSLTRIRKGQPAKYPERVEAVLEGLRAAGLSE